MSHKLWEGLSNGHTNALVDKLNHSIAFDQRLYPYDIQGSIAHVQMLGKQGIITPHEAQEMAEALATIRDELDTQALAIDFTCEDIHTFIELELTRRLGELGKKLHTGRSRNDQVALDLRLYLRDKTTQIATLISDLQAALSDQAAQHRETVMPGYTHLQRAQAVTLGYHLKAYCAMLERDKARLTDGLKRINQSPLGAGALAGSSFPLDRHFVAEILDFNGVLENTLDAVSSRDFALEFLSALSILMVHLSRLSEELILWSTQEFDFITLSKDFTTGSSMMPQKRNPDIPELVRGKSGRVFGDMMGMLTMLKALPLAYNKDMQEDKEALFDAIDTVECCLPALTGVIASMTAKPEKMLSAAQEGFLNATDLANYLVKKGLPFREAYRLVGEVIHYCLNNDFTLENLPFETYQGFSDYFEPDLYDVLLLQNSLQSRGIQ